MNDSVFLIINKKFRAGMSAEEMYQTVRGDWKVENREPLQYAVAIFGGEVKEIYEIDPSGWESVGDRRWKFSGALASKKIRSQCIGRKMKRMYGPFSYGNLESFMANSEINNPQREDGMTQTAIELLRQFYQIIFHGPPGTGKTRAAKQVLKSIFGLGEGDDDRLQALQGKQWDIVQFHPSYNYEDFVRGVQVETKGNEVAYETVNRIFGNMCNRANEEKEKARKAGKKAPPFAVIIDEINRANVSAVLGELIYALEYRGESVKTPYKIKNPDKPKNEGDSTLVIPENLYVIGTMNTADRTIGQIDYAVRRRFAFVDCPPIRRIVESKTNDSRVLKIYDDVQDLFRKTEDDGFLSPDFDAADICIGHSYFLPSDKQAENPLKQIAQKIIWQVVPILREYVKDGVLQDSAKPKIDEIEDAAKKLWPDEEAKFSSSGLHITNFITPEFNEQCDWGSFGKDNQHPISHYAHYYRWWNRNPPKFKPREKGSYPPRAQVAICHKGFWCIPDLVIEMTRAMHEVARVYPDFSELWLTMKPPHMPPVPSEPILVVMKDGSEALFKPKGKVLWWADRKKKNLIFQIVLTAYPKQSPPAKRQPRYFPLK